MKRVHSEPNLRTRKTLFGDHAASSIPGYMGHCPAKNVDDVLCGTWRNVNLACHEFRKMPTYDGQTLRAEREAEANKKSPVTMRAPKYDKRGFGFPAAGDTMYSRINASNEQISLVGPGVCSKTWQGLVQHAPTGYKGFATQISGFGNATGNIPGFTGHIPGKIAENLYGDTWSKTCENSVASHFMARSKADKRTSFFTKEHTAVPAVDSDFYKEIPIHNKSYIDQWHGWSKCQYAGLQIDPAGRLPPAGHQETYQRQRPPEASIVHGYSGYVPGRVAENVHGDRQCKTNEVSQLLTYKNKVRVFQR